MAAIAFYARLVDSALREVDKGIIEAAEAFCASRCASSAPFCYLKRARSAAWVDDNAGESDRLPAMARDRWRRWSRRRRFALVITATKPVAIVTVVALIILRAGRSGAGVTGWQNAQISATDTDHCALSHSATSCHKTAKTIFAAFFQLITIHRVVILIEQRHQPAHMGVGARRCLLFAQNLVEQGGRSAKRCRNQTTADSKQAVVQILLCTPASPALAISVEVKSLVHLHEEILFA